MDASFLRAFLNEVKGFHKEFLKPREIILPRHTNIPPNAESVNILELCELAPNSSVFDTMLTLKAKASEKIIITHYAIWTDAEDAGEIEFRFEINGNPIYRFHGRPNDANAPTRYTNNIGIAPDLSNIALIEGYAVLDPLKELKVKVINRAPDATDIRPVGVRLVGYIDSINSRSQGVIR